jgi:bifunctional enzyme CysN/CysC
MGWHTGPSLLAHLETIEIDEDSQAGLPLRMAVQWVNRPNLDFRGFAGRIASGRVRPGDRIKVLPSGREGTIARIVTRDGDLDEARAGQSVTLTLEEEVDCSRGDIIAAADAAPETADQFQADIIWMADASMLLGRAYWLKIGSKMVSAHVSEIEHRVDVNTLEPNAAEFLGLNDIALVRIVVDQSIPFDSYRDNHETGGFILIDRMSNATVAAGMIEFGLRRATNVQWQELFIDKTSRAGLKGQKPCVLWFTGLSGSGKSTIANTIERQLHALGRHTYMLDGDNVRHGLNKDLGFTDADRVENIRRVAETAKLFVDAGLIVMVSFISPFRSERTMAREMVGDGEFIEIYVDTPLEICEARDPKGLYRKARAGLIRNYTGIDSGYEPPEQPELDLKTSETTPEVLAELVLDELRRRHVV